MTVVDFQQHLESRGVAFLPAAGNQTYNINEVGELDTDKKKKIYGGSYWSSTCYVNVADSAAGIAKAYGLYFSNKKDQSNVGSSRTHNRGRGRSVRLVRQVQ